jgi:paraquat-inducible protein A
VADTANGEVETKRLVECPECGLRLGLAALPRRAIARCVRCGALLRAHTSLEACLALSLTGLVLILIANFMPFMSFGMEGREQTASLSSGALVLWGDGLWPLGLLILMLTIIVPTVKLGAISWILLRLKARHPPHLLLVPVLRRLDELKPWAMVEVYMLGFLVAYVKLAQIATVTLGVAVYALGALVLVMATIDSLLDYDYVWDEVERKGLAPRAPAATDAPLVRCDCCNLLAPARGPHASCPRCGAPLHRRKPDSVARCWALIAAAAILYIPANVFPIMTVISFGSGAPDTILSGVKHLFESGMWPLALLVFFASITVPVLKIVGLVLLLTLTQRGSR